jgi:hypothetical protein
LTTLKAYVLYRICCFNEGNIIYLYNNRQGNELEEIQHYVDEFQSEQYCSNINLVN